MNKAKNTFLEKQRNANQMYFNVGVQMGRQQIIDALSLALNDKKIMNHDTFGRSRLIAVLDGIDEYIEVFQKAWERDDETDYYRSKLDDRLSQIYGEDLHDTFDKRYEFCMDYDYKKGKWKK